MSEKFYIKFETNTLDNLQCDTSIWTPPFKCAVASCKHVFNKYDPKSSIKFHNFPSNLELQTIWLQCCGVCENFNINLAKVCISHFLPEDYEIDNILNKTVLKSTAVPTQFLGETNLNDMAINENNLLLQTYDKLLEQNNEVQEKLNNLKRIKDYQMKRLKTVKRRYKRLKKNGNSKEEKNLLARVFSQSQINTLLDKKKVRWSNDDMAMAFTLRQMGNRDIYLYLKKTLNIPLPSLSSVQKWAASK
ncbi:hypothetical protein FQA39_LY07459 [Lamprigera yunnana]|nr:hypothetical protein FQA39_LY07459 [Lamprigera yunnana]